ncbi:hypothetical protein INR49_002732 [Caranx melampygus]|nr:hypothetical protein INR49_002732 [Caranx melampygus]
MQDLSTRSAELDCQEGLGNVGQKQKISFLSFPVKPAEASVSLSPTAESEPEKPTCNDKPPPPAGSPAGYHHSRSSSLGESNTVRVLNVDQRPHIVSYITPLNSVKS